MAGKQEQASDAPVRPEEPKAARKRPEEPKAATPNATRDGIELQVFNRLLREAVNGEKRQPTAEERATARAAARKRAFEMVP